MWIVKFPTDNFFIALEQVFCNLLLHAKQPSLRQNVGAANYDTAKLMHVGGFGTNTGSVSVHTRNFNVPSYLLMCKCLRKSLINKGIFIAILIFLDSKSAWNQKTNFWGSAEDWCRLSNSLKLNK